MDRASTTETVDTDSIPGWVKSKTVKIGIHSFPVRRLAVKGTVWSLHRVPRVVCRWQLDLEDPKVPSVAPGQGNLVNKKCN